MERKVWIIVLLVLAFVLLVAIAVPSHAGQQKPPEALMQHISVQRMVHDGKCNFHDMKDVECFIFVEGTKERHIVWLVLFDNQIQVTHVIAVTRNGEESEEKILWVRKDA